jgi:hypothetical protein
MSTTHHILHQIIELETNADHSDHQALANTLSRLGTTRIPALTEELLNEWDVPGQVIQLDRIAIELECDEGFSLDNLLEEEFSAALQEALRKALGQPDKYLSQSVAMTDIAVFRWFLQHGYLPWQAPAALTLSELEYRVAEALAAHPHLATSLATLLRERTPLQRLLRQFSAQMPRRIAEMLRPDFDSAFDSKSRAQWIDSPNEPTLLGFWQSFFENPTAPPDAILAQTAEIFTKAAPEVQPTAELATDTGIFIDNAGLILLHPFLPTLLTALEAAKDGKITHPDKALLALHFAATGETSAPEWVLTLPKILCGIPLDRPAWRNADLNDIDKAEIEQMLQTVIAHWSALGNTSVEGLRESFLQRKGRLTEGTETWTLTVEQQAYDLLLEQLPWGIGMVKLTCMNKPLYTEWV